MKVALINASPRGKISTSNRILKEVRAMLPEDTDIAEIHAHKETLTDEQRGNMMASDIWVFANPLYIDSLPGHLLAVLEELESACREHQNQRHKVYALVNCGFHEAGQTEPAIRVYQNWCRRAGLEWCGAVGIGGGGAIGFMPAEMPFDAGPLKAIYNALVQIAGFIKTGSAMENTSVSFGLPRFLYILFAHYGWRKAIRANGKKTRDLYRKPAEEAGCAGAGGRESCLTLQQTWRKKEYE